MKSFCENFGILLKKRGWNQKEAAERLGVSQANISRWLSGEREPGLTALIQIAYGLEVTVDELLGRSEVSKLKSRHLSTTSGEHEPAEFPSETLRQFKTRYVTADPNLREFMSGQVRALFGLDAQQIIKWLNTP